MTLFWGKVVTIFCCDITWRLCLHVKGYRTRSDRLTVVIKPPGLNSGPWVTIIIIKHIIIPKNSAHVTRSESILFLNNLDFCDDLSYLIITILIHLIWNFGRFLIKTLLIHFPCKRIHIRTNKVQICGSLTQNKTKQVTRHRTASRLVSPLRFLSGVWCNTSCWGSTAHSNRLGRSRKYSTWIRQTDFCDDHIVETQSLPV